MKFDIEWESYHADGRKRAHPPASTIHGWLTKMRGTLLDNERVRRDGIREMKEASYIRTMSKKRGAERSRQGKPPVRPKLKQPWLRLSFLRNHPKPVTAVDNNKHKFSSGTVVQYKPHKSHSKHHSSDRKPRKKPSVRVSRTRKRSTAHKRSAISVKRGNRK